MSDRVEPWTVVGLRASFFSTGASIVGTERADSWWKDLAGEPPSEEIRKPREGLYDARGRFSGGLLQLQVQTLRVDWNLIPEPSEDQMVDPFVSIGSLDLIESFVEQVTRWIPQIATPIGRIAFGSVFQQLVADKVSGYKVLGKYLHAVKLDAENSSDFTYQINRPRKSKVIENLAINRLSKWGVSHSRPIALMVGGSNAIAATPQAGSKYAVRLDLDVNTDADNRNPFPHDRMIDELRELGSMALEIASDGDVK